PVEKVPKEEAKCCSSRREGACCPNDWISNGARPVPGRSAFERENWAKMLYVGPLSCRCDRCDRCDRGPVALRYLGNTLLRRLPRGLYCELHRRNPNDTRFFSA